MIRYLFYTMINSKFLYLDDSPEVVYAPLEVFGLLKWL